MVVIVSFWNIMFSILVEQGLCLDRRCLKLGAERHYQTTWCHMPEYCCHICSDFFVEYFELMENFHRRTVTLVLSSAVDNHIWNVPYIWSLFFLKIAICYFLSACLLY